MENDPQQILDFEADTVGREYLRRYAKQYFERGYKAGAVRRETNRLYRQNYGLTHNSIWDWGKAASGSTMKTDNTRMNEGLSGGGEGRITNDQTFTTNRLISYRTSGEVMSRDIAH